MLGYSRGSLRGSSKLQPALKVNINILFGLRPGIRGEVAIKLPEYVSPTLVFLYILYLYQNQSQSRYVPTYSKKAISKNIIQSINHHDVSE